VKLENETEGEREFREARHSELERYDVVSNLAKVVGTPIDDGASLRCEQFSQGRLRPFDTAGKHRLTPHEGSEQ
jgi:hypothetical protein